MSFWISFLKYVLLCWSLGLLSYHSQELSSIPIWLGVNIVLNMIIVVLSFKLFKRYIFNSPQTTNIEKKWWSILCASGISLVYLLFSFIVMRFFI